MKQYEITFLTREDPKGAAPVQKEIEALGGKIISSAFLGQKQLVYPIKKEKSAFYTTVVVEIEPEKVLELNRKLGLKEEILRHLIIIAKAVKIFPPVAPKPRKAAPEGKVKPAGEEKALTPVKAVEKPKVVPRKKALPAEPILNDEERLKALDKKLDELLKE
ncbi:MAG TPA: 30S ribosomal protein S6 [Patescibacteria group bacterium]|nr:30S ribosomal protein S6 [Patescibacteria group bacterium]